MCVKWCLCFYDHHHFLIINIYNKFILFWLVIIIVSLIFFVLTSFYTFAILLYYQFCYIVSFHLDNAYPPTKSHNTAKLSSYRFAGFLSLNPNEPYPRGSFQKKTLSLRLLPTPHEPYRGALSPSSPILSLNGEFGHATALLGRGAGRRWHAASHAFLLWFSRGQGRCWSPWIPRLWWSPPPPPLQVRVVPI
jgi:hypothetical protein